MIDFVLYVFCINLDKKIFKQLKKIFNDFLKILAIPDQLKDFKLKMLMF